MKSKFGRVLIGLLPLIGLLASWQFIGSSSQRLNFLYSTPATVLSTLGDELTHRDIWTDIGVTAGEVVGGLVVGNVLGTSLALALWMFPIAGMIARPYVVAIGSIPIFAVMPIVILWFGIGFTAKLAIITFSTAFVALAYSYAAAVDLGTDYEELIVCMGGSRTDLLRKIVMPGIVARSFVAYRINVSFALIGAYVAEWVSARRGLGQFILRATTLYDVPRVWSGLIIFVLIAFSLYSATSAIEKITAAGGRRAHDRPLW